MQRPCRALVGLGLGAMVACASPRDASRDELPPDSGIDPEALDAGEAMDTDASGDGGLRLDAAPGDGDGDGGPHGDPDAPTLGCDKVDLLFVVDESGSMADDQARLIAGFPDFIDGIAGTLSAQDYHVGIATPDRYPFAAPGCDAIGDLVTRTGGEASSQAECGPFASGAAYLGEGDDLAAGFACAAQVGVEGDADERPIDALRSVLAGGSGCNGDFLRDDALLVVVFLSDEDDGLADPPAPNPFTPPAGGSAGDPPQWFAEVAAAKGVESNVVVLSLVGLQPEADGVAACEGTQLRADRLIDFTERFSHGFVGSLCAESYAPFFADALAVIDLACEEFVPVP